jgi:hypothetical protein
MMCCLIKINVKISETPTECTALSFTLLHIQVLSLLGHPQGDSYGTIHITAALDYKYATRSTLELSVMEATNLLCRL